MAAVIGRERHPDKPVYDRAFSEYVRSELDAARHLLDTLMPDTGISLLRLSEKLGSDPEIFLQYAGPEIEQIFNELHLAEKRILESYTALKAVELLLYLPRSKAEPRDALPRFSRHVAEATKAVCAYLLKEPCRKVTIVQLSERFHVAETSLRECFKSIYGQPLGMFIRLQRMKCALKLLCEETELSIGQIAQMVGYENQSKFAAAFKAVVGESPLSYRHRHATHDDILERKFGVLE